MGSDNDSFMSNSSEEDTSRSDESDSFILSDSSGEDSDDTDDLIAKSKLKVGEIRRIDGQHTAALANPRAEVVDVRASLVAKSAARNWGDREIGPSFPNRAYRVAYEMCLDRFMQDSDNPRQLNYIHRVMQRFPINDCEAAHCLKRFSTKFGKFAQPTMAVTELLAPGIPRIVKNIPIRNLKVNRYKDFVRMGGITDLPDAAYHEAVESLHYDEYADIVDDEEPSNYLPSPPRSLISYLSYTAHEKVFGQLEQLHSDVTSNLEKPALPQLEERCDLSAIVAIGIALEEILTAKLAPLAQAHVRRFRAQHRPKASIFMEGDAVATKKQKLDKHKSNPTTYMVDVFDPWQLVLPACEAMALLKDPSARNFVTSDFWDLGSDNDLRRERAASIVDLTEPESVVDLTSLE